MKEWKRKSETEKKLAAQRMEEAGSGNRVRARTLALLPMAVMMMASSAFATEGSTTGLSNVLAQSTNMTTLLEAVFSLITGNAYLALMMLFGLMGAAIRLFRKSKRAAR